MTVKKVSPEVKAILTLNLGYDFDSEFWTDEMLTMLDEIYTATDLAIKNAN